MTEKTERRNGKWAKVTRLAAGRYAVGLGYEGNLTANKVQKTKRLYHANLIAAGWLDDL